MGLNIKNPDVESNIRKLASRTGENLTDAIDAAVKEKLARLDSEQPRIKPAKTLEEYRERVRPLLDEIADYRRQHGDTRTLGQTMKEFDDEFYDEDGLPK